MQFISPRLSPEQEMQSALEPLLALAGGDPGTVFAVAAMLQLDEKRHLATVFGSYLPALIQRAAAAERALVQGYWWPEQFFGDGSDQSVFQILWEHLGPVLAAGGLRPADQLQAVSSLSAREKLCFACVVGRHLHTLVGLAIFSSRNGKYHAYSRPAPPPAEPSPGERTPSSPPGPGLLARLGGVCQPGLGPMVYHDLQREPSRLPCRAR